MKKTPEVIWLHEDRNEDVVWSNSQPGDHDKTVAYIRSDVINKYAQTSLKPNEEPE